MKNNEVLVMPPNGAEHEKANGAKTTHAEQLRKIMLDLVPKELKQRYKGHLAKDDYCFCNLILLDDMTLVDAYVLAYGDDDDFAKAYDSLTLLSLAKRKLSSYYKDGWVKHYFADFQDFINKQAIADIKWSKERSLLELKSLIERIDNEAKPYYDGKKHDWVTPQLTSNQVKAKLDALAEIDKINGYSTKSQLEVAGPATQVLVLTGEEQMKKALANGTKEIGNDNGNKDR